MKEEYKRFHAKLDLILEQVITNKVEMRQHKRIDKIFYKMIVGMFGFMLVMHVAEASQLIKFIL